MDTGSKKGHGEIAVSDSIFLEFIETIEEPNKGFAQEVDQYLLGHNCQREAKTTKSGFAVSYIRKETKKRLATFVCRKTGVKLKVYPQNVNEYERFLDTLPAKMKKDIEKASICKRLINPEDCNPKCVKGYDFLMDGQQYQKCRHMAFMLTLNGENNPYIMAFLEKELSF